MEKGGIMTRKDSEKDAERPHYYSQFWLDIAAGRRVIGGPKPEEADASEPEVPEPTPVRKAGRNGVENARVAPSSSLAVEIENEPDEPIDEAEMPNIVVEDEEESEFNGEDEEEEETTGEEQEPEDEEYFDEEEEEEESEDWGRRTGGRKKAKPVRPTKAPTKPKRSNPRRNF
jgi:hypothetical protein